MAEVESCTLVQKNAHGKIKFMKLLLEGDTLSRSWGIVNGKVQTTGNTYDFINKGKKNQLDPAQAAAADYKRLLERKQKEGYLRVPNLAEAETFLEQAERELDFNNIPTGFCCSKPTRTISDKALDKLLTDQDGILTIKYNGLCHFIVVDTDGEVKLFTRRWIDHTVKYPKIVDYVQNEMRLPPKTILIAEFVIDPGMKLPHMKAFDIMSGISKVDTVAGIPKDDVSETLRRQHEHPVRASVFGVLYAGGFPMWENPYHKVIGLAYAYCRPVYDGHPVFAVTVVSKKDRAAILESLAANQGLLEGYVIWDRNQSLEVTMNGKPKRRAAWKIKLPNEIDVIAHGYEEGNGRLQGKIGALKIGQYGKDGKFLSMGTVSSGLKWKQGDCDIDNWEFPCVVEIEYDQRFPTGRFQFPRFSKKHEDKQPSEVEVFQN